jgi:hypothetical protein
MTCNVTGRATYIEEEPAIDRLCFRSFWEVQLQLVVLQRQTLQVGRVELLVAGDVDRAQIAVGKEPLPASQSVAHEIHRAVVVGWQVQLPLDGQDEVQVLFGLHKVA